MAKRRLRSRATFEESEDRNHPSRIDECRILSLGDDVPG